MRLITLILIAGLVGVATVPVGAQNATDQGAGANETYVGAVDDGVRVVSEEYSDGSMTVVLEADRNADLTAAKTSELNKFIYDSGGGKVPQNLTVSKTVAQGQTEVTVPVETHDGVAAVALTSNRAKTPYYAVVDKGSDIDDPEGWGPIYLLILVIFGVSTCTGFGLAVLISDNRVKDVGAGS